MKKTLSSAVLILLLWNQPSFAESNWFPQRAVPETGDILPDKPQQQLRTPKQPIGQGRAVLLKQPCDRTELLAGVIDKHGETILFSGTGVTFSPTGQPYRGGMLFLTNQATGSWTIVQVYADGMSCMIMNGNEFSPYSSAGHGAKK